MTKPQSRLIVLILLTWILMFIYLDFSRISLKVRYYLVNVNISDINNLSVQNLSNIASKTINKDNRVLFVSDDGLAYMYFNLLSYPIIAKYSQVLENINLKDYDFVIFYNQKSFFMYKNGVYNTHDIN